MDLATIDLWATRGTSPFHRAAPWAKLLGAGLGVTATVVVNDAVALLAFYLLLVAAVVLTGLPTLRVLGVAAYPAIFALLFAVSRWNGSLATPAVIVLKALTAALAMVLLITTTPYPEVFAALRRATGPVVGDALFLTYRSLFLLLDLFGHLLTALRLRGGLRPRRYASNARNLALGLGFLLIEAMELSQRLYAAMRVRGYAGHLAAPGRWRRRTPYDPLPVAVGGALLVVAVALQTGGAAIERYRGALLVLALLGLFTALLLRGRVAPPTGEG
ncbi:MAG TPA: CbiQ family ECF transporter T component [Chloroflexota bacterium]